MGKRIINVSNDFFEMTGNEGDVIYSFTGNCGLTKNSVLCDKTINLNEMYELMLGDVKEFLFGGEFVNLIGESKCKAGILPMVKTYTFKKYGITIENVYNKIHDNSTNTPMPVDVLYNELKVKYGMTGIDWMYLYDNVRQFRTNDVEILDYICNKILSNKIYEYFVDKYKFRTVGVVKKVNQCIRNKSLSVDTLVNLIKVEWNNGSRDIHLSDFLKNHKQWWGYMTRKTDRYEIRDYEVLLNNKSEPEVFPLYCPVFSNLRLNYTGIDFDGKNNLKKCSEIAGYSDKGETWSLASIDRIDSSRGYSYDNIRIISQYANQLKNVGSKEQIIRLGDYLKNNE